MSGFTVAWLDLREEADKRARDRSLQQQALQWLGCGDTPTLLESIVVDLGAGTGSTLRALSAPGSQHLVWRLVDLDGDLLDEAVRRHGKHYRIEDYQSDLTVTGELPLGGARLVTASALFDLVSEKFVDALVARLVALRKTWASGLYAALSYDGTTTWTPAHSLDDAVLQAFNRDQCKDKGFGPALGPAAAAYLQQALQQAGFRVRVAQSPWQLDAADAEMVRELINGIVHAVAQDYGLDATALAEWKAFRLAQLQHGTCTVGHLDVLALPD
jgi:hypothetical protein